MDIYYEKLYLVVFMFTLCYIIVSFYKAMYTIEVDIFLILN